MKGSLSNRTGSTRSARGNRHGPRLIIGAIAGFIAGKVVQGGGFGLIVDIIVGIVGAVIGGYLAGALGIATSGGFVVSIVVAVIGAVILLVVLRFIKRA